MIDAVSTIRISSGNASDLPALETLLEAAGLPAAELEAVLPDGLLVVRDGGRLVGAVALQPAGDDGLLRSLVVDPSRRGKGLGVALVEAVESLAARRGIRRLYLLTETAAEFFPRYGYEATERAEVPPAIAATAEFHSVCPAGAACLVKTLTGGG